MKNVTSSSLFIIPLFIAMLLGLKFLKDFANNNYTFRDLDAKTLEVVTPTRTPVQETRTVTKYLEPMYPSKPTKKAKILTKDQKKVINLIHDISYDMDIDPLFIQAIAEVESSYRPSVVSNKKAVGVMQVTLPASIDYCGFADLEPLYNPVINIQCGIKIVKALSKKRKTTAGILKAYNCGLGAHPNCGSTYVRDVQKVYTSL